MDAIAYLVQDDVRTYDEYGNEVISQPLKEIFVQVDTVYNTEFYNAAQAGLRPTLRFYITHRIDYNGETDIVYEGERYHVIRTDWSGHGVALICEEQAKYFSEGDYSE